MSGFSQKLSRRSEASSTGITYSNSERVTPVVTPLIVSFALAPSIRTRTTLSFWVFR